MICQRPQGIKFTPDQGFELRLSDVKPRAPNDMTQSP